MLDPGEGLVLWMAVSSGWYWVLRSFMLTWPALYSARPSLILTSQGDSCREIDVWMSLCFVRSARKSKAGPTSLALGDLLLDSRRIAGVVLIKASLAKLGPKGSKHDIP